MNKKLSEMQFNLFWMSLKKSGDSILMTIDQLHDFTKMVWTKSREAHFKSIGAMGDRNRKSAGGKIGGKTTGSAKARSREQAQKAARVRWDKEKKGD